MNLSDQLLTWYGNNKRDLPWRRTNDPYLVWLSEIILQQTRVDQGLPYYEKFAAAFPSILHLAAADEQEILKYWQGLGYYSRARNLHATAQVIADKFGGKFPCQYPEIRGLKGIGDYTAAAIASICFDLPYAVMDGNVMRFISRIYGIVESIDLPETKNQILAIATKNIDHHHPGDFNQAMMEFGATVCTPTNPGCTHCTFNQNCIAFNNNTVGEIPVRQRKATVRQRFIHYLVFTITHRGSGFIYLNKRTGNDIWRNLYDFPFLETVPNNNGCQLSENEFTKLLMGYYPEFLGVSSQYLHLLTHQKLHARFYRFHSNELIKLPYKLIPLSDLHKFPVPKLIDRYISDNSLVKPD